MATASGEDFTEAVRRGALEAEPLTRVVQQPAEVQVEVKTADGKEKASGGGHNDPGGQGGGMPLGEFRVALGELGRAIGVVRGESEHISGLLGQVERHFEAAHASWQSPSASSFETMSGWFSRTSRELEELLRDMARRMQTAYDNYAAAERSNTQNVGG
ncbi:WXG100 family type VII secretion target [Streptomyces sp. NPDC046977]|uniref:WXG100 family type VII secretion target n=1 Tax=Streptomyces sp. NPDC046977 TaxID=3154703 RepID=UPI0033EFCD68